MTARHTSSAVFLFVVLALFASDVEAQCVSLTTLGSPYNQDFNTLANTGTSSTVPAGWAFSEALANANTTYTAGTGSGTAGDTYSFGAAASSERAFGGLQSGTLNPTIGACFTNNTGVTVSNLTIAYTGEEWRLGAAARTDQLDFEYSLDATSLTTGTWTAVNPLDFITPNTVAPTGAKDGNNASFRTAISSAISPLSIANGATFWIRWLDANPGGADDGLAVDDFSLTPSILDVAPSVLTTSPPNGATGVGLAANIDLTFSEPVNVAPGWFNINCTVSGLHAATVSGGPTSFTLDPSVNFVANEICTVTIDDVFVSDQDANDPPDNMAADFVWSFDTNPPPPLVVNEIDYDQSGTDAAEFVEIRNNGGAPVNLDPVVLELVNGNLGGATVYQSFDLPNVNLAPGAYYVVCANNTTTPNCNLDVAPDTNLVQNGAPDAVALRWNGVLVDTVSYEGDTGVPYTETSGSGLVDDGSDDFVGISRLPDGTDTGVNNTDLSPRCITPGAANVAATASCPPPAILGLAIDDVILAEGQAGTRTFTFTVSLSSPAPGPGGVTFDIATADGTAEDDNPATEDNDYVPQTLLSQNIPAGNTEYTFDVTVNSDTTPELDETFFVNITNVVGAPAGDPQGMGTIQNDDFASVTLIHDIQGPGASSPEDGNIHTVHGVVTGVKFNGFFVQEEEADYDADPATSEGIFVFTSSAPPAAAQVGNLVYVTATVDEFVPSADVFQPPYTELTFASTVLDATGMSLPAPVLLTPTFPDPAGVHDQLERVEGMRVSVASLTVGGPTLGNVNEPSATATSTGVFYGTVTGVPRAFREPGIQAPDPAPSGGGTIPPIPRFDSNPEVIRVDADGIGGTTLDVGTSAVVTGLIGPLEYGFRKYTILPEASPTPPPVVVGGPTPTAASVPTGREFTVAAYNLERFFDTVDDPGVGEPVLTAGAFNNRLNKASLGIRDHLRTPDIVGIVEIENLTTLQALAARISSDAIAAAQPDPEYDAYLVEGNDIGGIDVGFLVKNAIVTGATPRVTVNAVVQENAGELFVNPDLSTSLLNDRPSLRLDAVVNDSNGATFPVTVIVNHLRSLNDSNSEDPGSNGWPTDGARVRAKRQKQAESLANLVQTRQTNDPAEHIILVGDFNAFEFNDGLGDSMNVITGTPPPDNETAVSGDGVDLVNPDLDNLFDTSPASERYSFVFDGNAQSLDHVVVNGALISSLASHRLEHPRINADFAAIERNNSATALRLADHDPVVGFFEVAGFGSAEVSLTKTDSPDPVTAGNNLTYTITITNAGPDAADTSAWSDTLPAGTTFVSLSAVAGWTCTTPAVGATGTVSCTNPSFAVGVAGFTLVVNVDPTVASGTILSNTATFTSTTSDPVTGNESDTETTTVATSADLLLSKTDSPDPVIAGTNLSYQITLTNNGPSNAASASFSDTLPTETTFVSLSTTGPWTCTTPAVGATGTVSCTNTSFGVTVDFFTLVVKVNPFVPAGTVLSNTATLSSSTTDPNGGNNSDTATTTVATSADVQITKTDSPDPVTAGNNITYTIGFSNVGPSDAAGVTFSDAIPANTTFVSFTSIADFSCSTPAVGGTGTITCTKPSPAVAGGSGNFTLVVNVNPGTAAGTIITNTATVTSTTTDPSPGNESATAMTTVGSGSADVSVTKTDTPDPVTAGNNLTYTITVNNAGPSSATTVALSDTVPTGTTFVSLSSPGGWSCTTPAVGGTGAINCSIATLGVTSAVFTLTVNVDASLLAGNVLSNTATVTSATADPNTGNESDTETTSVVASADVQVTKTDTPDPVTAGTNITYTITATNAGPSDAQSVTLADTVPTGTTFVAFTAPAGWTCATPAVGGTGAINCSIATFPAGGNAVFTLVVNADPSLTNGTVITNSATVASTTTDPSSGNNTAIATTTVGIGSADLSITKVDTPDPVNAGANLTYTITVNNAGPTNASTVGMSDTLPANTTFVSVSAPGAWSCITPAVGATGTVTCTNANIGTGNFVFTLVVAVGANTPSGTVISNTATVTSTTADPAPGNESATATTTVQSPASLSATKTVTGTFLPGGSVTYTIVVTNAGPSTQQDNPTDELIDVLPATLDLVSATATSGTAVATVLTNTVTWNGSLAAGASVTITINATIDVTVTPGTTISNFATVFYDADGNGSNESSRQSDNPAQPGSADQTAFTVAAASHEAIPTLDELALLALAALLAAVALLVMKR